MSRPVWFVRLLKRAFPSRFLAARLTKAPVLGRIVERWLFGGDAMIYVPSERSIQIGQAIDAPEEVVLPSQVVDHFIERAGALWIMDACLCRDANACQDYPVSLGCLFLGQAALGINPRLGRRVSREEALAHVRRCRAAGLVHLVGRNKLDTIWLGVGPGDQLLTICNCCPCCCLWRALPHMSSRIKAQIASMPGLSVSVGEGCVGCGRCAEGVCFVDAIHVVDGRAVIGENCKGCGRCAEVCPQQAIAVAFQDNRFVEEAAARIALLVDVS